MKLEQAYIWLKSDVSQNRTYVSNKGLHTPSLSIRWKTAHNSFLPTNSPFLRPMKGNPGKQPDVLGEVSLRVCYSTAINCPLCPSILFLNRTLCCFAVCVLLWFFQEGSNDLETSGPVRDCGCYLRKPRPLLASQLNLSLDKTVSVHSYPPCVCHTCRTSLLVTHTRLWLALKTR